MGQHERTMNHAERKNWTGWDSLVEHKPRRSIGPRKIDKMKISLHKGTEKSRAQIMFTLPEDICRECGFRIGDKVAVYSREDALGAVITKAEDGYTLTTGGEKGRPAKMFGKFTRGHFKIVADEETMRVFFAQSSEAYTPQIFDATDGMLRFLVPTPRKGLFDAKG